jgi:hypothetical protein
MEARNTQSLLCCLHPGRILHESPASLLVRYLIPVPAISSGPPVVPD